MTIGNVLRRCLNIASDGADVTCGGRGRLFQKVAPETGKARFPTVERLGSHNSYDMAPGYLPELCFPAKHLLRPSRYQLRSSQSNQLIVPPVKLSTYGPRSLAIAGPTIWNNLPEYPPDPELSIDDFRRQLKTFVFAQYC